MIYLDHGATSFPKPKEVTQAMARAMEVCANPGRGGHEAARAAGETVFACRERAAELFDCQPEQVVFTANCTQGLNMAIHTLVRPGARVVVSGFEHNAVTRPLYNRRARVTVAGKRLFDREDTLAQFRRALDRGAEAAVFTHASNVFGYVLPVKEMAELCRRRGIPFVIDAAQAAGTEAISLRELGADFIAMPGHKGLLGPMGTGMLLCGRLPKPFLCGGTGSDSVMQAMPDYLPDRGEAGTVNVPGIAGLEAGLRVVQSLGVEELGRKERKLATTAGEMLADLGMEAFRGDGQSGTLSFRCAMDCEDAAQALGEKGIAVRAGLHCAPLAHRSAGTLETGTVRLSFGWDSEERQLPLLEQAARSLRG